LYKLYNITVTEDLPEEVLEKRRILEPIARAANNLEMHASVNVDKLIINKKVYTTTSLDKLPTKLQPENVFTKTQGNMTAFFTKNSPLSNHSMSPFTAHNISFTSNEQYFIYHKAVKFNDYTTAQKIMQENDPIKIKHLGKQIKNFDINIWKECCIDIMRTGLKHKFDQNDHHRSFLLGTRNNTLIEASPHDSFWGVGKSLWDKDLFNSSTWIAKACNHLGDLLMETRRALKNRETV
jgi:ribA/ribD-fused uncharacterized protein